MRSLAPAPGLHAVLAAVLATTAAFATVDGIGAPRAWAQRGERTPAGPIAVPPFAAPPELSIFGPEVARAVAEALERRGVDVAGQAAVGAAGANRVEGRIESLDAERVRLVASVAGRSAQAEGPLERIDLVAADLSSRLAALVPATARRPVAARSGNPLAVRKPGVPGADELATDAPAPAAAPAPPSELAAAPAATVASAPPSVGAAASPAPSPAAPEPASVEPAAPPQPPVTSTLPASSPPTPVDPAPAPAGPATRVEPLPPATRAEPEPPSPATPEPARPARTDEPTHPYEPLPPPTPLRRGPLAPAPRSPRVVLRAVHLPDGCMGGEAATAAARDVLGRYGLSDIVSIGCGFGPPGTVMGEARRVDATAVVMADIDGLRMLPSVFGYRAAGRLRVVALREGYTAFSTTMDLTSRLLSTPDASRGAAEITAAGFHRVARSLLAAIAPPAPLP